MIQTNTYQRTDNYFKFLYTETQDFLGLDNSFLRDNPRIKSNDPLFSIELIVSTSENQFSRKVINILDFLANVGGIQGILITSMAYFIFPISEFCFKLFAISSFYVIK